MSQAFSEKTFLPFQSALFKVKQTTDERAFSEQWLQSGDEAQRKFHSVYSGYAPIHVVAGFSYQRHMPIVPEPAKEVKGGLFAVLPERGPEFLQCGQISKGAKHFQTACIKYENEKLNYPSFQVCRGDPSFNTLTAISASYNNRTKIVDFVMFFKGLMRYTLDGQLKQISLHQFATCPISFLNVFLVLLIITLIGIIIGILVFSGVYYTKLRSLSSEEEVITVARR